MNIADFDVYQELLQEKSGLALTQAQGYLIESRLNPIARKWGYESINGMTQALRGVPSDDLVVDIIEAMTTNETSFFRDKSAFNDLRDIVLPYYMNKAEQKPYLRIWCAAASSGQEPYSLAMLLKEEAGSIPDWHYEIIASDISHDIIEQGKEGVYTQFEAQRGLPVTYLMKYFEQDSNKWNLSPDIKKMVKFQYFNLLDNMDTLGQFDVIFCRNVLDCFNQDTQNDVMERLGNQLHDDGFLFLGHAESDLNIVDSCKALPGSRNLYVKSSSAHVIAA